MIIDQSDQSINGLQLLKYLRDKNISSILYPDNHKLKKQLKYANINKISYVLFIKNNFDSKMNIELKNMDSGSQENISISKLT